MKYIMFVKPIGGIEHYVPVIFPNFLVHSDVAKAVLATDQMKDFKVDSAGEYGPLNGACSGKSDTLNVKAKSPRDEVIISHNDYGSGFR